jgi:hypothetical protein|nr:MAG TPA: hypothetical protein [Caudoviricetes sp.]
MISGGGVGGVMGDNRGVIDRGFKGERKRGE